MSRQLKKLKNLVSEIEEIQREGRNKAPGSYRSEPEIKFEAQEAPVPEAPVVHDAAVAALRAAVSPLAPLALAPAIENKVSMELTGNIAVKLKLEESNEVIEVRRVGDNLAISFADGKSVHLPLKSVA